MSGKNLYTVSYPPDLVTNDISNGQHNMRRFGKMFVVTGSYQKFLTCDSIISSHGFSYFHAAMIAIITTVKMEVMIR